MKKKVLRENDENLSEWIRSGGIEGAILSVLVEIRDELRKIRESTTFK